MMPGCSFSGHCGSAVFVILVNVCCNSKISVNYFEDESKIPSVTFPLTFSLFSCKMMMLKNTC